MTVYFCPDTQGFFNVRENAGAHVVEVADDEFAALLVRLDAGAVLVVDNGKVLAVDAPPSEHHKWENGAWRLDAGAAAWYLGQVRKRCEDEINDAVADVLQPLTRFLVEYQLRESQARAWAQGGFTGDVPSQVAAFAVPAGIDAKEAARVIIGQADRLHGMLDALGRLRMRKFELAQLDDAQAVEVRCAEILGEIVAVAEGL